MSHVFAYEFKVFLEGIEIPVLGLDISYASASMFGVHIPPVNEANQIKENTHALFIFRKNKASRYWHILGEGVYTGMAYSKDPHNRTLRLIFRDVQWFLEAAQVYEMIVPGNMAQTNAFGIYHALFLGDSRYADAALFEREIDANVHLASKFRFLNALNEAAGTGASPLGAPLEGLWELLAQTNEFYRAHAKGFKLNKNRIHIIDNPRIVQVFTANLVNQTFNRIFTEMTNETNVMDLMLMLLQIIQYDIMPIPGMASINGSPLRSYVIKPYLMLATPPACNVIFPHETMVFNFNIDYTTRPTRFWLRDVLESGGLARGFFAPREIEEGFKQDPIQTVLTEEERLRGVRSQIFRLPWAYTRGIGEQLDEERYEETSDQWVRFNSAFASYKYYEQKYFSTPMNITIRFRPDILPGFPILILDPIMPMMGYALAVTHFVDMQNASAQTGITLSHVRPAQERVPLLAGWYDEATFSPSNINNLYLPLGTQAFFAGRVPGSSLVDAEGFVNYYPAVQNILEEYMSLPVGKRHLFEEMFNRELPVFWDEQTQSGEIANALNLRWDKINGRLEPLTSGHDESPFTITYEGKYPSTSSVRRPPIETLRYKIIDTMRSQSVWKRDIEEGV